RYSRSTCAHNTLQPGDAEQCEFWGAFRVGRRGTAIVDEWKPGREGLILRAHHTGFRYLPGRPIHRRSFEFRPGRLLIRDEISPNSGEDSVVRFHLHPEIEIQDQDSRSIVIILRERTVRLECRGGNLTASKSDYFPEFG